MGAERGITMTVKKIVLIGLIVLLAVLPLVVRHYRGNSLEIEPERPRGIPIEEVLDVHDGRIKDRIDLLKKQTLDESFVELLEDQQYYYPGFQTQVKGAPTEIETILSTRTFLKVFQEFGALPREQAVVKLNEFCKRAVNDYDGVMEFIRRLNADPSLEHLEHIGNKTAAHNMLCASMLLAARMGEHHLLLHQMDEMQRIFDASTARKWENRSFGPLEDDAFLTILMYALKQAKLDIPVDESTLTKKTIPLYRWDAPLTHYDFAVWHGDGEPNPKDLVEHFVVYAFPMVLSFSDPDGQKSKTINTLKERLSK